MRSETLNSESYIFLINADSHYFPPVDLKRPNKEKKALKSVSEIKRKEKKQSLMICIKKETILLKLKLRQARALMPD